MSEWKEIEFYKMLIDEIISYGIVQPGFHTEINSVPIIRVNNIKDGKIKIDNILKVDKSIEEKYQRTRLKGGELLITVVGNVGECAIVPPSLYGWNVARAVSVAKIKDEFDIQFIRYAFKTEDIIFQMYGNTNDTVQPTLNLASLKALKFSLPPLPEQRAIASILSSLDDKIDLLHHQNATLEKLAETLFRQWFVEEAGEEWEEKLLGDLIEIKGGFTYKSDFIGSGDSLLLSMGCVSYNDRFLTTGARAYSGECPEKYLVKPGDLVIATRQQSDNLPILGFPAIVPDDLAGKKVIVGANLYRVNNNSILSNYLIYLLLKTRDYKNHIISSAKGSTVRMITKDAIESYRIIMPPKEVIDTIKQIITPINNKSISIITQIRTLTALRDSLLPKLMSGELRVAPLG